MNTEVAIALITAASSLLGIGLKAYVEYKTAKTKKTLNRVSKPKLCTHSIFNRLTMYCNQVTTTFSLENKGKEQVFKCLLLQKLQISNSSLQELITILDEKLEKTDIKSEELYQLFKDNLDKSNADMNQFFYQNDSYTKDEKNCLEIVNKKFLQWHYARTQYMYETIYNICCASLFYDDAYSKCVTVLDIYCSIYSDMLTDAQQTLNSLNGDLKGLRFRGYEL